MNAQLHDEDEKELYQYLKEERLGMMTDGRPEAFEEWMEVTANKDAMDGVISVRKYKELQREKNRRKRAVLTQQ